MPKFSGQEYFRFTSQLLTMHFMELSTTSPSFHQQMVFVVVEMDLQICSCYDIINAQKLNDN